MCFPKIPLFPLFLPLSIDWFVRNTIACSQNDWFSLFFIFHRCFQENWCFPLLSTLYFSVSAPFPFCFSAIMDAEQSAMTNPLLNEGMPVLDTKLVFQLAQQNAPIEEQPMRMLRSPPHSRDSSLNSSGDLPDSQADRNSANPDL